MRIGSLFSGVGGLELGLERAGLGTTVWQVEIDPGRRAVLAARWPSAIQHADVRLVGAHNLQPVEVICGGFPCQDISDAARGRGAGIAGERSGLWRELVRVVEEIRPRVVVVENVGGAAAHVWLPALRGALHVLGYRTRALRVDAADLGAPHRRARVFVVAYADDHPQPARALDAQVADLPPAPGLGGHWRQPFTGALRVADGVPGGLVRGRRRRPGSARRPRRRRGPRRGEPGGENHHDRPGRRDIGRTPR